MSNHSLSVLSDALAMQGFIKDVLAAFGSNCNFAELSLEHKRCVRQIMPSLKAFLEVSEDNPSDA